MALIEIEKLHDDPRNANVCGPDILEKLRLHIDRTGFCPTLLVRPHSEQEGHYIILDGHHRKLVVTSLGWSAVECQIKDMSEEEAGILLLTLNRLRGTDVPRKRAELMESLLEHFNQEELAVMLPESPGEIEGLLALLKQDETELEKAFKAQLEAEEKALPVPFGFMVSGEDANLVRETLAFYQAHHRSEQGDALVAICRDALSLHEADDGQTET